MTPFEFLQQEFENVQEALKDSLRHDYGPEGSNDYFKECSHRLRELEKSFRGLDRSNYSLIADKLGELDAIASWISLIERSHLGEFSWPFANALRKVAVELLSEGRLRKRQPASKPIVHVIGAGEHYEITTEETVSATTKKHRFVIVGFPRSLKHHVLLHALFGHELGHAVIHSGGVRGIGTAFQLQGPLSKPSEMTNWLDLPNAPKQVRDILAAHKKSTGEPVLIDEDTWVGWASEIACDLFGLVLFGPAFAAATRTFLRFREKYKYLAPLNAEGEVDHHPPYACRHKVLTQALRILQWDRPISSPSDGKVHKAELAMLESILEDEYDGWAKLLQDSQIEAAINAIRALLSAHLLDYAPPTATVLTALVQNLADRVPPVATSLNAKGEPILNKVQLTNVLYAGWVCWLGRQHLPGEPLSFLDTNKFCHLALIQNDAIRKTIEEPEIRSV